MKELTLSKGQVALVDDKDFEWLKKYKWTLSAPKNSPLQYGIIYPKRNGKRRMIYLHRIIAGAKKGEVVDHVDGNGLNNQRTNLRIVTQRQNMLNRKDQKSKIIGVTKHRDKYWARIRYQGKHISLGLFTDQSEAVEAYKNASKKYYGDKAFL